MLKLKRAYDPISREDGVRFLVERLWPRGLSKAKLRVNAWLKEAGPRYRASEVVQSRSGKMVPVPRPILPRARLGAGGMAANPLRRKAWNGHSRLQLP